MATGRRRFEAHAVVIAVLRPDTERRLQQQRAELFRVTLYRCTKVVQTVGLPISPPAMPTVFRLVYITSQGRVGTGQRYPIVRHSGTDGKRCLDIRPPPG